MKVQRALMPIADVWKAYDHWCAIKNISVRDADSRRAEYLSFVTVPGDRIEVEPERLVSMHPRTANRIRALLSPHRYALYKAIANLL